jgi:hypothetical protein
MYFYRLGHQRDLANAEFVNLIKSSDYQLENQWLLTNTYQNTQSTGSVIFSGEVLT